MDDQLYDFIVEEIMFAMPYLALLSTTWMIAQIIVIEDKTFFLLTIFMMVLTALIITVGRRNKSWLVCWMLLLFSCSLGASILATYFYYTKQMEDGLGVQIGHK